jgi:hypothetical protein
MLPPSFVAAIERIVGHTYLRQDADARLAYGTDALKKGMPADLVAIPGATQEVAAS